MSYDLVRSPDYDMSGTWHVLVDGERIGTVRPCYGGVSTKRWKAYSASSVQLRDYLRTDRRGRFRTRVDAAAEVLAHHRRLAERRATSSRRSSSGSRRGTS